MWTALHRAFWLTLVLGLGVRAGHSARAAVLIDCHDQDLVHAPGVRASVTRVPVAGPAHFDVLDARPVLDVAIVAAAVDMQRGVPPLPAEPGDAVPTHPRPPPLRRS